MGRMNVKIKVDEMPKHPLECPFARIDSSCRIVGGDLHCFLPEDECPYLYAQEQPVTIHNEVTTQDTQPIENVDKLDDMLMKYLGLPPYDGPANIVRADAFYYQAILRHWTQEQVEARMKANGWKRGRLL